MMFLWEAYEIFRMTGFSTLAALRPDNVLLLKDQPAGQCKC